MKVLTLSSGGMNWTWYIVGVLSDGQFTVLAYDRLHNERDVHPEVNGTGELIEADRITRHVVSIRIDGKLYPVANPRQVFSYPKLKD